MPASKQNFFSVLEQLFARIKKLGARKNPGGPARTFSPRLRKGLTVVTVLYFVFLFVLLGALRWWGDGNWFFSLLLFLPAALWTTPLLLLTPLHLLVRPKLCGITFAAFLVVCFVYLDFCWSFSGERDDPGLTVLTNNIGERDFQMLLPFVAKENPDLIALQDAWGSHLTLAKQFPGRFVASQGEYALVSKFPIRSSGLVHELLANSGMVVAWFEIFYEGRSIVVYNVHMPTPRYEFRNLRGPDSLLELARGKGIFSSDVRKSYARFVERKTQSVRQLLAVLHQEKRPFIVTGDFNMPANSYDSGLVHAELTDAFRQKGRGYGATFPETSHNWLASLLGPWLRLDYLLTGNGWEPLMCRVEPRQPAQHLAVIARFKLKPAGAF